MEAMRRIVEDENEQPDNCLYCGEPVTTHPPRQRVNGHWVTAHTGCVRPQPDGAWGVWTRSGVCIERYTTEGRAEDAALWWNNYARHNRAFKAEPVPAENSENVDDLRHLPRNSD